MNSINPADGLAAARLRLLEIWADSRTTAFARRCAGDPQVAEDARQATYLAMASLRHLDEIEDLRAYFYRVLVRAVRREKGQLGALLVEDFTRVTERQEGAAASRCDSPGGFEDEVCASLQAESWHKQLIGTRGQLMAAVPARSGDPARYRAVIYAAAEQILRDGIKGDPGEADTNDAFRAAYPEYFDQPGGAPNTLHQRFRRARTDVRELLQAVVR